MTLEVVDAIIAADEEGSDVEDSNQTTSQT
jgi:hypothetical protein